MPDTPIELTIYGDPAPQGSKTAFVNKRTGKAIVTEGGSGVGRAKHREWRQAVAEAALSHIARHPMQPLDEPVAITIQFRLNLPSGDRYRTMHAVKPDLDKLIRSVLDSLVDAHLLTDDSRVWQIAATKVYAHDDSMPGATVFVSRYGVIENERREARKSLARRAS